jgi:hypothetical protein
MVNRMPVPELPAIVAEFHRSYAAKEKDAIWKDHSRKFKAFWKSKVLSKAPGPLTDEQCDEIIRILDRNGKGNTKDSEAVAKAMIPQGAWRRMFNEFHSNSALASLMTRLLEESKIESRAALIDELYMLNRGKKNNLTGPSGNAVGAFLAAYDPFNNLSVISLKDRRALIEFLDVPIPFNWDTASIGEQIAHSNDRLVHRLQELGIGTSARAVSEFCYFEPMKYLWKGENTVKRVDKDVNVTVPLQSDDEKDRDAEGERTNIEEVRESMQIQALLARIGTSMGFTIWLPRADRTRVLKAWRAQPGELLDNLPLGYDSTTMKTIEQIDVIWLRKRSIVRAFEVEHTTSVYSGLLRMADLVALQPNIDIKLHIVAPESKRDKVLQEIRRPVFSLLEGRPLNEICTFLSYDSVRQISDSKHLVHLSDSVIEDYEETAG